MGWAWGYSLHSSFHPFLGRLGLRSVESSDARANPRGVLAPDCQFSNVLNGTPNCSAAALFVSPRVVRHARSFLGIVMQLLLLVFDGLPESCHR